jgi:hypothetical protein
MRINKQFNLSHEGKSEQKIFLENTTPKRADTFHDSKRSPLGELDCAPESQSKKKPVEREKKEKKREFEAKKRISKMFENDQHHKGKEERESEVDEKQARRNATRHKSKQMFCSLKRTAKIPPNGLIK